MAIARVIHAVAFGREEADYLAVTLAYNLKRVRVEKATLTTERGLTRPVFAIVASGKK